MTSPGRTVLRSLLVAAAVPLALGTAAIPTSASPVAPGSVESLRDATSAFSGDAATAPTNLAAAKAEATRLRTEVDALAARARRAADAADHAEQRYLALAGRAAVAQRDLAEARRHAAELADVEATRVRALYMAGGHFGAVNTVLRADGLGALSSAQENVTALVEDDANRARAAVAAAAREAAAKAKLDGLVAEQSAASAAAMRAVDEAAAALRTRRGLLQRADTTVQEVIAARAEAQALAASATAAAGSAAATGLLDVPVGGAWVRPAVGALSSLFGPRWGTHHAGIDFAARQGSVIRAASSGAVTMAQWYGGYGNAVDIDHGGGVVTRYGHASEPLVVPGEYVTVGQPIALVGSTGDSTGPHLHFEVRMKGTAIDPLPFLRARGVDVR